MLFSISSTAHEKQGQAYERLGGQRSREIVAVLDLITECAPEQFETTASIYTLHLITLLILKTQVIPTDLTLRRNIPTKVFRACCIIDYTCHSAHFLIRYE
jgi:hypothetical protein